ncbi:MAG: glutamine amidotransferase, partial [Candidatus Dadabacteria bacterium]|nr:glutamine amidotransferase [Candidatus Dadabacteria bacterium]NIV41800.1 glutamine amidotransferase [Candidatus Dadabacteria bacterium]NIX16348.1 glutamine amidotransferase [Candidatus Dadabacteria bacterium]
MSKLLVFRHVAYEILGTLDPLLRNAGFRIKYVNFERHPDAIPNIDNYDGLIVLGGPMNVDQ